MVVVEQCRTLEVENKFYELRHIFVRLISNIAFDRVKTLYWDHTCNINLFADKSLRKYKFMVFIMNVVIIITTTIIFVNFS